MDELERRVLNRVLAFCQDKQLIGPYKVDQDTVQVVVGIDYQTLTLHKALLFLLGVLERAGLADEFYETLST